MLIHAVGLSQSLACAELVEAAFSLWDIGEGLPGVPDSKTPREIHLNSLQALLRLYHPALR
jgi:hypothetical protein